MATIIRKDILGEAVSGRAVQPVAFSFSDMRGQANDYLGTVRAEAAKIVQQAHQQAEQIRRQAEAAGRKAAEAAIEQVLDQRVGKRMATLVPALERLIAEMNDTKAQLLSRWERSALGVATTIAKRIIGRELSHDPRVTLDMIEQALRLAAGMTDISVHVSPTDYENLGTQITQLAETLGHLAPSAIVSDPEITAGGCKVYTKFGEIDQQIEAQLRRIEEELS
jgi:flagellar assembly protein FliH